MYNILIVEDDRRQAEALKLIIEDYYGRQSSSDSAVVHIALDYKHACKLIDQISFNTFLLDIDLNDSVYDGISLAEYIREQRRMISAAIIFITVADNRILTAVNRFHCYGYITKPYDKEELLALLDSLRSPSAVRNRSLIFKDLNGVKFRLDFNEILFIENNLHTMLVHAINGIYRTRDFSLKELSRILDKSFVRCHKKYIVSLNNVSSYDKSNSMVRIDTLSLPVGRTYKEEFEKRFYS